MKTSVNPSQPVTAPSESRRDPVRRNPRQDGQASRGATNERQGDDQAGLARARAWRQR